MNARVDTGYQVALPGEALNLPGAEGTKSCKKEKGDQRQADQKGRGAPGALPVLGRCHGISLIFCMTRISWVGPMSISICACGIMFAFR